MSKVESTQSSWVVTPLVYSKHISSRLGADVYLKLENLQPCQSFKYRGILYFIDNAIKERGTDLHLYVASGGNAGLAVACVAKIRGLRCTIYLPQGASSSTLAFFKQEGAQVVEKGSFYQEALAAAEQAVISDKNGIMIPAYNDKLIWEGHASMIEEIATQLPHNTKPDAIFCSVGGAGLAGGVMKGCKTVGWDDVPVVTLETTGSNCFYQSLSLNQGPFLPSKPAEGVSAIRDTEYNVMIASLPKLTSRASSLGASWPAPGVVKMALTRAGGVRSVCVPDEFVMKTSLQYADEHKMLAELACATTLVPAYSAELFNQLVPENSEKSRRTVIFIVCGGFKVSLSELAEYNELIEAHKGNKWDVLCNGEQWCIAKE